MSFRLNHIVGALDQRKLKADLKRRGLPGRNIKPLLMAVADLTNDAALGNGVWWSLENLAKRAGICPRSVAYLRDAGEGLGILRVHKPGTEHAATTLTITNKVLEYVDFDALTRTNWELAAPESVYALRQGMPGPVSNSPTAVVGEEVEAIFPSPEGWGSISTTPGVEETTYGVAYMLPGVAPGAAESELNHIGIGISVGDGVARGEKV